MHCAHPLFNENSLKLGVFGFNGRSPSHTVLDELYMPSWRGVLDIGRTADDAGFEALVPSARRSREDMPRLVQAQLRQPPRIGAGSRGSEPRFERVISP